MDRLELINKATEYVIDLVNSNASCSEALCEKMTEHYSEDRAVMELALEIIKEMECAVKNDIEEN